MSKSKKRRRALSVGRHRRPRLRALSRRGMGRAPCRRRAALREARPRRLSVRPVVAHDPEEARQLPPRLRRLRRRADRPLRRARASPPHGRRRHRPQPAQDRRHHRQRQGLSQAARSEPRSRPSSGASSRTDRSRTSARSMSDLAARDRRYRSASRRRSRPRASASSGRRRSTPSCSRWAWSTIISSPATGTRRAPSCSARSSRRKFERRSWRASSDGSRKNPRAPGSGCCRAGVSISSIRRPPTSRSRTSPTVSRASRAGTARRRDRTPSRSLSTSSSSRRSRAPLNPGWPSRWRLAALLHDAPEYVIGDLISPFKTAIGLDYKAFEAKLLDAIHRRFGVPAPLPPEVAIEIKRADRIAAFLRGDRPRRLRPRGGPALFRWTRWNR